MTKKFLLISAIIFGLVIGIGLFWHHLLWYLIILVPLFFLGLYDLFQTKHTVLRNFPVIGHIRFIFEIIRPEIHQYFIESDLDGTPLNRERRSIAYQRAKKELDTSPYGTKKDVYGNGYEWLEHSLNAKSPPEEIPRIKIGGPDCTQPYHSALLNISAMSFGALSDNAILALNKGANAGDFYHNTGEGGLTPYHLKHGGDIVWQIGTGYFGCRTMDGNFDEKLFSEKANLDSVKMIEIKISQGAKPGHGGILPAVKLTPEIAEIRGVPLGQDVLSPPGHTAFSTPIELCEFIAKLRKLSNGKPIGFKLCVGSHREFFAICKAMLKTNIKPDFITVDGAEGGTGAAPLEFSNAVGSPLVDGLMFIHNALHGLGLRDDIKIIASGKIITAFEAISKLAMGADLVNSARGMMLALGCIQSLKCNSNTCPTGVTTQDRKLINGLVVEDKYLRVQHFQQATVETMIELISAAGLDHPDQLRPYHIHRRVSPQVEKTLDQLYPYVHREDFLKDLVPDYYKSAYDSASAEKFN